MKIQRKIQEFWNSMFETPSDECGNLLGYSYYAFISYTEKDEKWAEWLQWELEHYCIPTKVRSEYKELPARIRPVFFYKNDLAGAHLSGAIKKELEQSKYLIVVCSQASANKEWVNDEVHIFKEELGRGDKIIPFVVDGEINTDNIEQECLPRPIRNLPREKQLRCIDVRDYGKNKALVNIVSTLLDIRFDILWNRFKREQHQRFAIRCAVFALLTVVLFGCLDYFLHTKYDFFIDIADCYGMPTGIMQINKDEAKGHYRLYRFEKRRGLLRRVVYVDCDGNPQNHTNSELADRPCIQELLYNNGELAVINCKDATNKTLYIMHLSKDKLAADLKDEDENLSANFIYSSTSVDQGKSLFQQTTFLDQFLKTPSKIGRYIYERDDEGYITKKIYARHSADNDIGMDANGISGFEYERDSLHRVTRIRFLDNHYEYKSNNLGVAGKKYEYDIYGNLTVAEYVDKGGNLKYNEHHWAKAIDKYDAKGYCIEERLFGTDGEPCFSAYGYHKMVVSTNGNKESFFFYDIHNNPSYTLPLGEEPGGYSVRTNIRNKKGQIVEMQFMDSQGKPCYNQNHQAIIKVEYDDNGLVTDIRNYDTENRPCSNNNGFFHQKMSYNQKGNLTETCIYNNSERPVQNIIGIHKIQNKYDSSGYRIVESHAYNQENMPMNCYLFNGAAWVKFGYHGSSNWVSDLSFYGVDNEPIETVTGARVSFERDLDGQVRVCKYYNYCNGNYELYSNYNHCAIMEIEYNEMGMMINRCFYDENKNPTLQSGVFQISLSYTKTGQVEKICLYDTLHVLYLGPEGWAMQKFNYKNGVISSNSYYGEGGDDDSIEIMGVFRYQYEIDECGYVLSQSAFNKVMRPTINLQIGAHKVVNIYDENRRNIGRDYYDAVNLKPFVRIRLKLNQRGLQTEQTAYNTQNELVESPLNMGVAKIQSRYDNQDRVIYMCATDKNGEKMNTVDGFAECIFSYDNDIYETVYLDSNRNVVNNNSLNDPFGYMLLYITETGQRLFRKTIKLSYDNEKETVREAYSFDKQNEKIHMAIQLDDWQVQVYDVSNNKQINFYSFEDEYDEYVHIVDSIQNDIEMKYGKPKLYKYVE